MAKNTKSINELVEKLALLADQTDKIFISGKKILVFELNKDDFKYAKTQLDILDENLKRFNVDISGVEILFIEDGLLKAEEGNS